MIYNKFDVEENNNHICIHIPQKQAPIDIKTPKENLLAQGTTMFWEYTMWWQKILVVFFLTLMLIIPLLTNWMNVQMVQGSNAMSFAVIFVVVHIMERLIDVLRNCFLLRIASALQSIFLRCGITHYASLSKPSRLSNPAYNFMKFLQEASWSINHLIEWGIYAMGSMVGQSVSAGILLFVFDLEWIDYIILPIAIAIAFFAIQKLQKILTERQEISREIGEKTTDLEQLKAIGLQNGDIGADEIINFLLNQIHYDNYFVRPLYNYIGSTLDITLELVALAYAIYLPTDRAFVAKLVLIRTISSALNSVTHFLSQYNRYCNQYLKYRKHFDKELSYDEHREQLSLPEQGLEITNISIRRGDNYSIEGENIAIELGKHILIQGPSGAGKTSFVDAIRGFISGITLSTGVPGNYSHHIYMHAQSCASSVQLTSVSLADLFDTTNPSDFERIHELLEIVFSESELTRILENISKEQPFQTNIDGKLSGGQQARIFIALTLWNIEKYSSKITIFDEIESALDSGNRVSVLKKLYAYLNVRNIATIWITHMCQCELSKCGIDFDGGRLILCPLEDGTGARIQHNKQN
jgi:ABC-type multidrug transport system fused ATPase/permease subunit